MFRFRTSSQGGLAMWASALALCLPACGGDTGNERDSGLQKTTLRVEVADANAASLQYQWRVTAGSVENRNAAETVWTLPDGPGLHFAYVVVSDGQGGYAEQQYAVATDALDRPAPAKAAVNWSARAASEPDGALVRLRVRSGADTSFQLPPPATTTTPRQVYLPDVRVQVTHGATLVYSGSTDLAGELSLPSLPALPVGDVYKLSCSTDDAVAFSPCGSDLAPTEGSIQPFALAGVPAARNLRLFGHVARTDGTVCGNQNDYFDLQSAATVELQAADGTALSRPVRVNRFGDYAVDAAVPAKGPVKAVVRCEGYSAMVDVPASSNAAGYLNTSPVELSHVIARSRPRIVKMVGSGPDGNVRGQMVVPETGASSNSSPGANHFLTYKGRDSRMSACMYYRSLGAAAGCDSQGRMIDPISFDDWKRQHQFGPYAKGNTEVAATYINRMDLNLVRRMVATRVAADQIAFYVCNSPGPEGTTQREIDQVLDIGLRDEKRVACVAMEWSVTAGANAGKPFTKFLTFGPDGSLLTSINLDGRGEKYMPGACVACHGGKQYNGRFPEKGDPSPYIGSGFLPFDTGNYYFGSATPLTEAAQSASLHALNALVVETEGGVNANTSVTRLFKGWYADGSTTLDKLYVPDAWKAQEATTAGAARFYREVVGASCRTCHVSLGASYDWDSGVFPQVSAHTRVCGGTAELALNASMPNALISRDRVLSHVAADTELTAMMNRYFGCSAPLPDPVYPRR